MQNKMKTSGSNCTSLKELQRKFEYYTEIVGVKRLPKVLITYQSKERTDAGWPRRQWRDEFN